VPDDDGSDDRAPGDRIRSAVAALTLRDALTILVALALVVGLFGVVYVALTPQQTTDPYTEFYVLGAEGNASDYPTNLTVDEQATVTVGVVNHEQQRMTYTLLVRADDRTLVTRTLTVQRDRRWEAPVSYAVARPGRISVRFMLYRGDEPSIGAMPYRQLRLWTNVSER